VKSLSARKIARGLINLIGAAAGLGGIYFLYETGSVLWDLVSMSRGTSQTRGGLAAPAVMMVGGLFFLEILVFGVLTVVLFGISAWALEPRRRWRDWRASSRNRDQLLAESGTREMFLRERIKADLPAAMRERQTIVVATLRSLMAAIDNAGAVEQGSPSGPVVGRPADVARKTLSDSDVRNIVQAEADERTEALVTYERLGRTSDADRLRKELIVIGRYL
jgi:uncharacterized protein YqeY